MPDVRIELSPDQKAVMQGLLAFAESKSKKYITLGGYAGSGKSTILGILGKALSEMRIAYCCYTGKAASVLASKLGGFKYCGTIHSLIYRPYTDELGRILGFAQREDVDLAEDYDLIVIDEASMVSEEIFEHLLEYGVPIIAVGDHGQLPPVKSRFNLMQNPMLRLEKIHRQAENSPIIKLSMMARTQGAVPFGEFGDGVRKVQGMKHLDEIELDDVLLLCGTNRLRQQINRQAVEGRTKPEIGDKVICLKNNAKKGIYNGMGGFVQDVSESSKWHWKMEVLLDSGDTFTGNVLKKQFGEPKTLHDWRGPKSEKPEDLFDWAYAITVHKSQGSQAQKVVLLEETLGFLTPEDWKRWLYTGITRSQKELLIIKP